MKYVSYEKCSKFYKKVIENVWIDTKKYRYVAVAVPGECTIKRVPREYLGTTAALDGWEIVAIVGAEWMV